MNANRLAIGSTVRVKEPERWCNIDGQPLDGQPHRVTRIYCTDGYKRPWIVLDDGGTYRASDLVSA